MNFAQQILKVLEKCQASPEYVSTVALVQSVQVQAEKNQLEVVVSSSVMQQYHDLQTLDIRAYYPLAAIYLLLFLEYKYMKLHRGHGAAVIDATDMVTEAGFNDQLYPLSDYFVRYTLLRHGYSTTHAVYSRVVQFMFNMFVQGRSGYEQLMARVSAGSPTVGIPVSSKL